MKKQVYINPETQVFQLTGMQIMQVVSDPGNVGNGGGTDNMNVIPTGD